MMTTIKVVRIMDCKVGHESWWLSAGLTTADTAGGVRGWSAEAQLWQQQQGVRCSSSGSST